MGDALPLIGRHTVGVAGLSATTMAALDHALGDEVEFVHVAVDDLPSALRLELLLVSAQTEWSAESAVTGGCPVVLVAEVRDEDEEYAAIERGAIGFVAADAPAETLRRSVLAALNGEVVFGRKMLRRWLQAQSRHLLRISSGGSPSLSSVERQILLMIAEGATNKEIALRLGRTHAAVEKQVSRLMKRIGVPNRAAAVGVLHSATHLERVGPDGLDG